MNENRAAEFMGHKLNSRFSGSQYGDSSFNGTIDCPCGGFGRIELTKDSWLESPDVEAHKVQCEDCGSDLYAFAAGQKVHPVDMRHGSPAAKAKALNSWQTAGLSLSPPMHNFPCRIPALEQDDEIPNTDDTETRNDIDAPIWPERIDIERIRVQYRDIGEAQSPSPEYWDGNTTNWRDANPDIDRSGSDKPRKRASESPRLPAAKWDACGYDYKQFAELLKAADRHEFIGLWDSVQSALDRFAYTANRGTLDTDKKTAALILARTVEAFNKMGIPVRVRVDKDE
jgi:hypothetical protein